jgi:hypothetical protein
MNPSKMRNTYGKLMYILMDTESYQIKSDLKLSFIKPIMTVYSYLEEKNRLDILQDPLWSLASMAIVNVEEKTGRELSKREMSVLQTKKQQATEELVRKYSGGKVDCLCFFF